MAIKRAPRPVENFYMLDKRISEDTSISWAARGLLIYLLGKPDHWEVSVVNLINQTSSARIKSGRDSVRALLKELLDVGYIERVVAHEEDGKFAGYDYLVTEAKKTPATANPATANPATANPPQVSIDGLVRNEVSKEEAKASLSPSKLPDCPHVEIINLFAEHLPVLPQPKAELWDGQRAKNLAARWKWVLTAKKSKGEKAGQPYATDKASALAWFARYFTYVADHCPHLVGNNDRSWTADLAWLVKADNFGKVLQGNYESKV